MKVISFLITNPSAQFLFLETAPDTHVVSQEQLRQEFHESLESASEDFQDEHVRNYLRTPACDMKAFDALIGKKFWTPAWNEALAQSLGKERLSKTVIGKIQAALGTVSDGKFGPHSMARLFKLRGDIQNHMDDFSSSYIDRWDDRSKSEFSILDSSLSEEKASFLQSLFQNEISYYSAQALDSGTIKMLDGKYMVLVQQRDRFYRVSVDLETEPPSVGWEEVLSDSFYDKTFGNKVLSPNGTLDVGARKPILYSVQSGDNLINILKNTFGKTYTDMQSMEVDYRDSRRTNAPKSVLENDKIYPGQKIWIEDGVVVIAKQDERKTLSSPQPVVDSKIINDYLYSDIQPKEKKETEKSVESEPIRAVRMIEPASIEETPPFNIRRQPEDLIPLEPFPDLTESVEKEPHNWRQYEDLIEQYYENNAFPPEGDSSWISDSLDWIGNIFSNERSRSIEYFTEILLQTAEHHNIPSPTTKQEMKTILDTLFDRFRQDSDIYRQHVLLFDPSFARKDSYTLFKQRSYARKNREESFNSDRPDEALRHYERTQKIIQIINDFIQEQAWEQIPERWNEYADSLQGCFLELSPYQNPEKVESFVFILRGLLERYDVEIPASEKGVQRLLNAIFYELQEYPEVWDGTQLSLDPLFLSEDSFDFFKSLHKNAFYPSEAHKKEAFGKSLLKYNRTQRTIEILDDLVQKRVWET